MSEKKLRELVSHAKDCWAETGDAQRWCEKVLIDPPDVVGLALELLEDETVESSSGERYISLPVERLYELLGAMFGVRLTDDGGWEYLEEK